MVFEERNSLEIEKTKMEELKMKKVIVWLLALVMVFSMVACGGNTEAEAPAAAATEAPAAAPAVEEAEEK